MKTLKFLMVAAIAVMATVAMAQTKERKATISIEAAREKIPDVIADPNKMGDIMQQLATEDQTTFLSDVNTAISKLQGFSYEEKTELFLSVNRAAVQNAAPGNISNMVAEVFATVPPESLTAINENFGDTILNRATDSSVTFSDQQFTEVSKAIVDKVQARTGDSPDAAVRTTFAVLMMVKASNGSPSANELATELTADFKPADQLAARNEWIPAALGSNNQVQSYDPLLGVEGIVTDVAYEEKSEVLAPVKLVGPQTLDAMLSDITLETVGEGGFMASSDFTERIMAQFNDPMSTMDTVDESKPVTPDFKIDGEDAPWMPSNNNGDNPPIEPGAEIEPTGYKNQTP